MKITSVRGSAFSGEKDVFDIPVYITRREGIEKDQYLILCQPPCA
jgi:hypothetical protein